MSEALHSLRVANERDVVAARQHARTLAESLGFDHQDGVRIATAVSEIARNAFRYATGGEVVFAIEPERRVFCVTVKDKGAGIPHLDKVMRGSYRSQTGMGMGLIGTKRLMDEFVVESTPQGTTVRFGKHLPEQAMVNEAGLRRATAELKRQHPATPLDELQTQNRELMQALTELRERKEELARINAELQDTNRGVVALYAELDERADYLRRASELKSSFLSNMSHEFRTPLNSIVALTRLLLDRIDGELTSDQDQQLRFIQQSARELSEMVDDLLDLAKVEAGRLDVRPRTFEVAELFGALRGMLRPLLADGAINLVFEPAEEIASLYTDEQKVSQILRNFISNAIKFTPRGEVRVSAVERDGEIEFAVTDTGIGISESDQRIIFEEFAQIESSMQRRVKGTGLGLPLSKKLAELLGGRVEVSSEVSKGSTFRLVVPRTYPGATAQPHLEVPRFEDGRKLVLIVEDNPETAFVYSRYLTAGGYATHTVGSVEEAQRVLTQVRPAAIILDLLLRSDTSWNFLREIKSEPTAIPVLVMSVTDDAHRVYGMGANGFLQKPFVPEQMMAAINSMTEEAPRPRILMIDDHEVSRYLLRENLPEDQYEVFEAREGREGIRMARELKPAVIFLDYYMPDLNGTEVLKDLRSSSNLKLTPIILHSTKLLDAGERQLLEENGVSIFSKQSLTQPDAATRLRELVNTLAAHARAERGRNA